MNRLRAAVKWNRWGYDSDTGYFSSGSDRPLTDSQFILRPSTAMSSFSASTNYPTLDYEEYPCTSCSLDSGTDSYFTESTSRSLDEPPRRPQTAQSSRRDTEDDRTLADSVGIPIGSPFPFDETEDDLEDLFDELEVEDEPPAPSTCATPSANSTLKRKKLLILEPDDTSKIYYEDRLTKIRSLPAKGSIPRSILKKEPSLCHIYEEILDDHLSPYPEDVRPKPPERPNVIPIRIFPPCKTFQPKRFESQRYPSFRRRKKLPSLHHSQSLPARPIANKNSSQPLG